MQAAEADKALAGKMAEEVDQVARVVNEIEVGERVRFMANDVVEDVDEIGVLRPAPTSAKRLATGEVGYLITGIKEIDLVRVGDTITEANYYTYRVDGTLETVVEEELDDQGTRITARIPI